MKVSDSHGGEEAAFPNLFPPERWDSPGAPGDLTLRLMFRNLGTVCLLGAFFVATGMVIRALPEAHGGTYLGLLLGAAPVWTTLMVFRRLLDGESEVSLGGAVQAWVLRLPDLLGLALLLGLAYHLAIPLGAGLLAQFGHRPEWNLLAGLAFYMVFLELLLAPAFLALPILLCEGVGPLEAVRLAWSRARPWGWALWSVGVSLCVLYFLVATAGGCLALLSIPPGTPSLGSTELRIVGKTFLLLLAGLSMTLVTGCWALIHERSRHPQLPQIGRLGLWGRFFLVILIGSTLQVNFEAARRRGLERSCMANLKTLEGALEMKNLDEGRSDLGFRPEGMPELVRKGYLQEILCCPLSGEVSVPLYVSASKESGGGPLCLVHGDHWRRQDRDRSGRHQKGSPLELDAYLRHRGVRDPRQLSLSRRYRSSWLGWPEYQGPAAWKLGMAMVTGLANPGWMARLPRTPGRPGEDSD